MNFGGSQFGPHEVLYDELSRDHSLSYHKHIAHFLFLSYLPDIAVDIFHITPMYF